MAHQRPFSRFRLPWLSAVTAQPQPQPQLQQQTTRPIEIVAPAQPQRPPFQPAGIAQAQQPTQPLARTEPQPPSPGHGVTQVGPQPPSPSLATTRAVASSLPPSPSRATARTMASSVPPLPSRATTRTMASSVPPSPSQATTRTMASSMAPSPSHGAPVAKTAVSLQEAAEKVKEIEQRKRDSEKRKAKEDKKTITTGSIGEQIKTVSSIHPKPRNKLTESRSGHKPGMSNYEQNPLQKEIKDDISKFVHKLATGKLKEPMDDEPVSIVTIAGENTGASMHVGSESVRKEGPVHIHRGYKLNPDESTETTTDAENSTKGKKPKDPTEEQVKKAFINSNIQSINNSMFFESSVNEVSPGIHLFVSQNLAEPIKEEPLETHKAEFSVTPAQKLTYDPTIRRRCLRGLFLESSDTDPDNPEKPRRHGCRYYCGERSKAKDMDIL